MSLIHTCVLFYHLFSGNYSNDSNVAGIFTPGGSIGNLFALLIARYKIFPECKTKGNIGYNKPLVVLTSTEAHYSVKKNVITSGIGLGKS